MRAFLVILSLLFISTFALTSLDNGSVAVSAQAAKAPTPPFENISEQQKLLEQRYDLLKQQNELLKQQNEFLKNQNPSSTPWALIATIIGAVLAALIAGISAVLNQNRQAMESRLLKIIEFIMSSPSSWAAETRRKFVVGLLPPGVREHFEKPITSDDFYGPEGTQVNTEFARSMSEKAKDPGEVLAIWKGAVGYKGRIGAFKWPPEDQQ